LKKWERPADYRIPGKKIFIRGRGGKTTKNGAQDHDVDVREGNLTMYNLNQGTRGEADSHSTRLESYGREVKIASRNVYHQKKSAKLPRRREGVWEMPCGSRADKDGKQRGDTRIQCLSQKLDFSFRPKRTPTSDTDLVTKETSNGDDVGEPGVESRDMSKR